MTELEKYELVNKCETFEELAKVIESLGNKGGHIEGRTIIMSTKRMAAYCRNFMKVPIIRVLTRKFGIRQQALYIKYYKDLENSLEANNSCEP